MSIRVCMAIATAFLLSLASESRAGISIEIGGFLLGGSASSLEPLAPGSLLQLIDLGPDGVFNPLTLGDVGGQWVSGDDRLLMVSFSLSNGSPDFASTAAFDLAVGTDTPGMLSRVFVLESDAVPAGTKLGLRWFPGLAAATFDPVLGPANGQIYGEFTRQSVGLHGGTSWIVPGDGAAVSFDPLVTVSQGGLDPNAAGQPSHTVTSVPEPASMTLAMLGGVYLLGRRPRRTPLRG